MASGDEREIPQASGDEREIPQASGDEEATSHDQIDVTQKRKRGGRGKNKMPTGHYTITHVNEAGVPILPVGAAAAFRRTCSSLGRTKVRITYENWKLVPQTEKMFLWETLKGLFAIPEASLEAVERQALVKIGKAWKTFKSELYNQYVKQDLMPYRQDPQAYGYLEDQWPEFVERCNREEFVQLSQANKARQARNTHPHRLGTGGYARKELDWEREDELAARENRSTVFTRISERRARNWYRGRAESDADGAITFNKAETAQVAQRILELSEESIQGTFQAARERDILTAALGNKEHPGRTHGSKGRKRRSGGNCWFGGKVVEGERRKERR